MKQRIFSAALALCLFISSPLAAYAEDEYTMQQDIPLQQEAASAEGSTYGLDVREDTSLTPTGVHSAMIALKEQEAYKEGAPWTNDEPYSDSKGYYHWKGGPLDGKNVSAVGCVAFAFILSDAAFGSLPARMYAAGGFSYEDIKVGDILRVNNDAHTVIVLEVSDVGVVVAEGNISTGDHKGKVHWGRAISKEEVMSNTSHYITRYPEGYVSPEDPDANKEVASGTLDGGLTWSLIEAGTLTISGSGAMPDYSSAADQPWGSNSSQIRKVVIGNGVTSIGACAFWNCGVLSAEIPASVTRICNSAFRESSIISVTIPSGVKTIGDSAFRTCPNLSSVTVSEGVETIEQNAFQSCAGLTSITLPASIGEVGAAAFFQCQKLTSATFAAGSKQVKLGDNLFTQCYELMDVKLPQSIDRISNGMFQNCLLLSRVEIPQGTEIIEESAFASCSRLTTVVIPDSITSIGTAAFSACPLADIYFTGTEAQWNSIRKIGDTAGTVSKATIHYNYVPEQPTPPEQPAPDTDIPFIENESGTKGWDAIKEKAEAASDGAQVQVNMNRASTVPGYVLDSIKGKNVTISFDMGNGIVWLVNGKDVTADHANDVNLSVQVGNSNIPQNIINNTAGNRQTKQLSLAHSGEFGYSAVLRINMDSANAGLYANLFYYNEGARRLEFVTDDQIDGNGTAELTFTHASDYVIVIDRASMDDGSGGSGGGNGGSDGGNGGSGGGNGGNGGGSGGSGGSGSGGSGSGGSGDSGSGGGASGGSNSGGTSSGNNSGSPSADGTGTQGTEKRSPMTGEFDIVFGGSNAAGSEHKGNDLSVLWLLAIGTAGMAITVRKRNKISGR